MSARRGRAGMAGVALALVALVAGGLGGAPATARAQAEGRPSSNADTLRLAPGPARVAPRMVQVTALGDSTWMLSAGTANVTATLTARGWVLVDTGTRLEAPAIRDQLRRLAPLPVRLVIDTHFHDDHAGGNGLYLGSGVPVWATSGTQALEKDRLARLEKGVPLEVARLEAFQDVLRGAVGGARLVAFYDFLIQWWREGLDEARADPHAVEPADHAFDGHHAFDVAGVRLDARELPTAAHTGSDAVVLLPRRQVVAVGDVFAPGSAPWADQYMGGGSIVGLLAAQDTLLAWLDAVGADSSWRLVPGHGPAARVADLRRNRGNLATLVRCARLAYEAGRPRDQIAEDCAGAGFPGRQGAYMVWLLCEEWDRAQHSPAVPGAEAPHRRRVSPADSTAARRKRLTYR